MNLENNSQNSGQDKSAIEDSDFILIRAYIEGDEGAFATLVNLHKDKVRNLVF